MLFGLFLLLAIAVVAVVGVAYARTTVPDPLAEATAATTTVLYKDGSVMGTLLSPVNRTPLAPAAMPQVAKEAAVASEDRSFYQNRGVSVSGIARAVYGVLTHQADLGGGSTITQQYVKNITGHDDHTFKRKANEALVAVKLDQQQPKDQILTSYLNTIYFGRNTNGVAAAAQAYFGLSDPSKLTFQQAALLIGIIPAPSAWDPAIDPTDAQKRYSYVLAGMVKMGYITQAQAEASPTMPATVAPSTSSAKFTGTNGYILNEVQDEAASDLATTQARQALGLTGGTVPAPGQAGLTITTTIDPKLQQDAVDAMNNTRAYPARNRPATLKSGLVSLDPTTGGVVAMYGGPDFQSSPYDTVTQGAAQAGSTFKPFTLLAALEQGISLSDTFSGRSPQYFSWYRGTDGKPVPVSNFGSGNGEQFGNINLVKATEESVNTVFVQLNHEVGPAKTAAMATRLGVTNKDLGTNAANVLGTDAVKPIDMATAYATLADGGVKRTPHFIASMTRAGQNGKYTTPTDGTQVVDAKVVADAVYAMQQVVKGGTAASVGRALGKRPAAGKTGTVQLNHAAWFDGFTPQLATVAVLYNTSADGKSQAKIPPYAGYEVSGGTIPAAIWTAYSVKALAGQPIEAFPAPSQQVQASTPTATATSSPTYTSTSTPTSGSTSQPSSTGSSSAPTSSTATTGASGGSQDTSSQAAAVAQTLSQVSGQSGGGQSGGGQSGGRGGGQGGGQGGRGGQGDG